MIIKYWLLQTLCFLESEISGKFRMILTLVNKQITCLEKYLM